MGTRINTKTLQGGPSQRFTDAGNAQHGRQSLDMAQKGRIIKNVKARAKAKAKETKAPPAYKGKKKVDRGFNDHLEKYVHGQLHPRLGKYFKALAEPFTARGAKCPVNYNPVPSIVTNTATTSTTLNSVIVTPATSTVLAVFPGHNHLNNATTGVNQNGMDGVSYHHPPIRINAIDFSVGPITVGSTPAIGGVITGGLTVQGAGSMVTDYSGSTTSGGMSYDQTLPFGGSAGNGGHSRWKLVSCGIMMENTTPLQTRGGLVQHVMPSSTVMPSTDFIRSYSSETTYRESVVANMGTLALAWIPRIQDLAFWHTGLAATATHNTPREAGILAALVNNTANSQTYSISVVWNWELSGHSLVQLGSPAILAPADQNVVEPVIQSSSFIHDSFNKGVALAKAVAPHLSSFVGPRFAQAAMSAGEMGKLVDGLLGGG